MIDDKTIAKIAEDAANKAINFIPSRQSEQTPQQPQTKDLDAQYEHKAYITKPSTPQTYYYQRFYGLSDKAKNALNQAYLIRKEPFTDKRWVELMVDFTEGTKKAHYTGTENDLRTFKTMAVYYAEKYRKGSDWHKNEGFRNTIKDELNCYRKTLARPDLC